MIASSQAGISLSELSPVSGEYLLVSFKAFFDGGGKTDDPDCKVVTLAAVSGSGVQWDHFTERWNVNLETHRASFLHTTDAMSLQGAYRSGWTTDSVRDFIEGCVTVIERCATTVNAENRYSFVGLWPVTVSVKLSDFARATKVIPDIGTVEHVCVVQAVAYSHAWALLNSYQKIQLYFDQGESFRGHMVDRTRSKKVKKDAPGLKNVIHVGESDMREVPALQAADLFAWTVNRQIESGKVQEDWQRRLLAIPRQHDFFNYKRLSEPNFRNIEVVKSWKLPVRRKR
jgi:hypothetical protein